MTFKPMLPRNVELDKLKFPVAVQEKWDGERLIYKEGQFLSRALKPITNLWLVAQLDKLLEGVDIPLDGEIQVNGNFKDTSGFVRKSDREADFVFHVFDSPLEGLSYEERWRQAAHVVTCISEPQLRMVNYTIVDDIETLMEMHQENAQNKALDGTIVRNLASEYKYGRATVTVGQAMKIKDFEDSEGEIIGFTERMHNTNKAQTNELGRTFRSSAKGGLEPTGMLATYRVKWQDVEFEVTATGTLESRKERWDNRDALLGKFVKFQYMGIGNGGRPRHPVELGIRDEEDMS